MRFRTLALALALVCGSTALTAANQAKKAVVHKTARKGTVRKAKNIHKAKRGKTTIKPRKHA